MKITYLGQAGFLLETNGQIILIDPYLSDSVEKIQPKNYRRVPVDERFLRIKPNLIIITHNHADHLDKETLCHYLTEQSEVMVLAPNGAWQEVRKFGGLKNNYVLFNNGTTWTEENIVFRAVKAEHSDEYAIGVIVYAEGKAYYFSGDTLYNQKVLSEINDEEIEAVFLPVNGKGNNMNFTDAKRFAERINTKYVVPIHIGMFDELTAENWQVKNKIIPQIYKEIL